MAMRVVARVVETGNMTEAARQLGIGQPFVSRIVAEEEHRLGVPLLHRGPPLRATEAGLAWARDCAEILARVEDAEAALNASWTQLRGTLRIAAPAAFAQWVLAALLPRFLADNRGLSVELVAERPHFDLDGITADLAIHVGALPDTSALTARGLGEIATGLFAAPAYLDAHGAPATPADLAAHATCLPATVAASARAEDVTLELSCAGERVTVPLRPRLATPNPSALATAAEEGLGIALLPKPLGRLRAEQGRLQPVLAGWSGPVRPIHAVWPSGRAAPRKVKLFVDFLLGHMRARLGG